METTHIENDIENKIISDGLTTLFLKAGEYETWYYIDNIPAIYNFRTDRNTYNSVLYCIVCLLAMYEDTQSYVLQIT